MSGWAPDKPTLEMGDIYTFDIGAKPVPAFTENMAHDFLSITKDDGSGKHAPFTVWEETQLLHAWLRLQKLRDWAVHKAYCEKSLSKGVFCQCGLDEALR